jgi:hypothetical protein
MFIISLLRLFATKLSFELMDSYIYTCIGIVTGLGNHKDIAVFCPGDYLHACLAAFFAIYYYFDLIGSLDVFSLACLFNASVISICLPVMVKSKIVLLNKVSQKTLPKTNPTPYCNKLHLLLLLRSQGNHPLRLPCSFHLLPN